MFGYRACQVPHCLPSSTFSDKSMQLTRTKFLSHKSTIWICRSLLIASLFLFVMIYLFLSSSHPCCQTSAPVTGWSEDNHITHPSNTSSTSTNISHLVFGIAGSTKTWGKKKYFVESWWRRNITRGFLFLDSAPIEHLPWPSSSPPMIISENTTSRYKAYDKHRTPFAIRIARVIEETYKAAYNHHHDGDGGIRWYVMGDDDTVFFTGNLVDVLSKYDHNKYYYIGMNSESLEANGRNSFGMAFGGGGYALSYPLAEALAKNMDGCIKRYPTLYGSDHIVQACVADLGVSLTLEKGFHQVDLRKDISGYLSAHPQSPLVSLHHLDILDPIFPAMDHHQSLNHLMKVAAVDESRLLQQTICYHKQTNWSFSISWGYSIHIYEKIIPSGFLQLPIQTFTEWKIAHYPALMFNTRFPSRDPCDAPHIFFFDAVEKFNGGITTDYIRRFPRGMPTCTAAGVHSADELSKIRVISLVRKFVMVSAIGLFIISYMSPANLEPTSMRK